MTQTEVRHLAESMMQRHGLSGWTFAFNRARRMLGVCRYHTRRIELSRHFVEANDEAAIRDTILHEIAHAMAGPTAGHGPRWRAICRQIGARPTRCDRDAVMPAGRWQAACPKCDKTFHRHRKPLRGRVYSCGVCGPTHGRLRWKEI